MQGPGCDNGACQTTDASFTGHTIYTAPVFTQHALSQISLKVQDFQNVSFLKRPDEWQTNQIIVFGDDLMYKSEVLIRDQPGLRGLLSLLHSLLVGVSKPFNSMS